MTLREFEKKLDAEVESGKLTPEEADQEYQDFLHRGEDSFLGVYGW